jgi:RimJ/RimL family protein N-acetyltransferase
MGIYEEYISLKPASIEDRNMIYQWMAGSNITPFLFDDENIPGWDEFIDDYQDFYFNGSAPKKGRGFIILYKDIPIGFISYAAFHLVENKAELDIWMSGEENCGKGIGSSAIKILCDCLSKEMGINEFLILPSIKNGRAIRAYEKAGFIKVDMNKKIDIIKNCLNEDFLKEKHDYDYIYSNCENLLLVKKLKGYTF